MADPIRDRWIDALVALEEGESPVAEATAWAVGALEAGEDSPTLRLLAGLLPGEIDGLELVRILSRATRETGRAAPAGEALRRAYIPVACRAMLRGELSPDQALDRIHRRVVAPLGHPLDLMRWCHLWEGHGPECEYVAYPNTEYVLAEARAHAEGPCR